MKKVLYFLTILGSLLSFGCQHPATRPVSEAEQWDIHEIVLKGRASDNPYTDVELSATFSLNDQHFTVPGFYDGDSTYRIRFSPPATGEWFYITKSNEKELSGQEGNFNCLPSSEENHGPLKIVNTFYLEYADGTPFYSIGTTAYQWVSAEQKLQEKTIETLQSSPFNKIRMGVFPKYYQFGNQTEPWLHPFKRENNQSDYTQPEYEYFRNLDKRIRQLMEMGIQADVILFHPYDNWGYSQMGKENNERYVRYMIARFSAYRNVWWSLANEWNVPAIKDTIDWEGIGILLQKEDPHQRLRGIHNWRSTEDHFYDHTREWITHVSTQTSEFYNAIKWRNQYQKPLLFDEMRYEGDIPRSWGDLTAEQMSSYFWMAGLSGGYPTHGDTYNHSNDSSIEARFWAKGGIMPGKSPERIAFFKSVMEHAPVKEMIPELVGDNPLNRNENIYIFSKPGTYYLAYTASKNKTIELELEGEAGYKLEVMDTWNMEVVEDTVVNSGTFSYQTKIPYTALRLYYEQ